MKKIFERALALLKTEYPELPEIEWIQGKSNTLSVQRGTNNQWLVEASTLQSVLRGTGLALAEIETFEKAVSFDKIGIMLDCSRGAVMKTEYLKKWFCRLAMLGYNQVMLYTENTYELPGEPYFGYCRGAYSAAEIRELDGYARQLGIELLGCIQTLGHLEQILRWEAYSAIKDTDWVLLANEQKTYDLITKMISFWSENVHSRRLHIGMDEAFSLGSGNYLKRFGYKDQSEIFNRHLTKVRDICENLGLRPMIWSDMYFQMKQGGNIPDGVELVAWDYDHTTEDFYKDFLQKHRDWGCEPVMASGIWTWSRMWHDQRQTEKTALPCIHACKTMNIREILFTMWGNGGSLCEFDSAWTGLVWCAQQIWTGSKDNTDKLYRALTGKDFAVCRSLGDMQIYLDDGVNRLNTATLIWEDPLYGIAGREYAVTTKDYREQAIGILEKLAFSLDQTTYEYPYCICRYIVEKLRLLERIENAYRSNDRCALTEIIDHGIPLLLELLEKLQLAFRKQWLKRNKPFGMEIFQIRAEGNAIRFKECSKRIQEYLDDKHDTIPEYEQKIEASGNKVEFFDWVATGNNLI